MTTPGWHFQVTGSLAQGFAVVDTTTGEIVSTHDERVDANRACADRNRAYYRTQS